MAEGDRSAVRVDARIVVTKTELAETGQRLRRESFVELDDIHRREIEVRLGEHLPRRGHGPHPHDARLDAGHRRRHDTRERRGAEAVYSPPPGNEHTGDSRVRTLR